VAGGASLSNAGKRASAHDAENHGSLNVTVHFFLLVLG
jgi:hypothetical protein